MANKVGFEGGEQSESDAIPENFELAPQTSMVVMNTSALDVSRIEDTKDESNEPKLFQMGGGVEQTTD